MIDYKTQYLQNLIDSFEKHPIKVLDMGCGTAKDWINILENSPHVHYTGLEFDQVALSKAKERFAHLPHVRFVSDFGENMDDLFFGNFDLVISLSVLEHVKHLDKFLYASVKALKTSGTLVHRYDLGHALHSETFSERCKVFLCKYFPFLISAKKFTTHPDKEHIIKYLQSNGIENIQVEQHQIPNLKKIMNRLKLDANQHKLIAKIIEIDQEIYNQVTNNKLFSDKETDFFFPAVTIRGIKTK
jgi:ubiquinone/menaquinone biosynthesis C-methylase UbiE